jgi:hypothetical protein
MLYKKKHSIAKEKYSLCLDLVTFACCDNKYHETYDE